MKNSIYMVLLLVLTPLASLPMSFLTNNSLTNRLAFLSRMRFTKPNTIVSRPYFSKSINVMQSNRDELGKEINADKVALINFNKDTTVRTPERIKEISKAIHSIKYKEDKFTKLQDEIKRLADFNREYNAINAKLAKSLENSNFEEANNHTDELYKKYCEVNKFKDYLKDNWYFTYTKRDQNGHAYQDYYKFDEE